MEEKTVVILGATGSIGTQSVDVINKIKGFKINGIAFGRNQEVAEKIIKSNNVDYYYSDFLTNNLSVGKRVSSIGELLERTNPDIVIIAITGFQGVKATIEAIKYTKRIALAAKEAMVCAGPFVKELSKRYNVEIVPVDSEHSAIFQIYEPHIERIAITASGGAVRNVPLIDIPKLTPEKILMHPTWNMGSRITVDSATMVNKFFEVVEAHELFSLDYDRINVYINPSSFVHGIVFLKDGTIKIHAGKPDMRVPIAYALTYPSRRYESYISKLEEFDLSLLPVEKERYPLFYFALELVGKSESDMLPERIALNSADEIAVQLFLERKIKFGEIEKIVKEVVEEINKMRLEVSSIEDIYNIDGLSRKIALSIAMTITEQ
ncbi:MAG: 1-deoxy-D-xylulose-5-phosphate reductoisomerase [Fervidobacterium sp.]